MPSDLKSSVSFHPEVLSDDLIHELRQPLSVIDTLAYYLELTAPNEKALAHSQRIQAMVQKMNLILAAAADRSVRTSATEPLRVRSAAS